MMLAMLVLTFKWKILAALCAVAGLAFKNSVKQILPGMGSPGVTVKQEGVVTNVGTTAVTFNGLGGITAGKIRVKTLVTGAGGTNKVGLITATDGTTTIQLYAGDSAATAANQGLDEQFEFISDLAITSITVNVVVAVANGTHDVEVALVH